MNLSSVTLLGSFEDALLIQARQDLPDRLRRATFPLRTLQGSGNHVSDGPVRFYRSE
jgi:hypothetical protein